MRTMVNPFLHILSVDIGLENVNDMKTHFISMIEHEENVLTFQKLHADELNLFASNIHIGGSRVRELCEIHWSRFFL